MNRNKDMGMTGELDDPSRFTLFRRCKGCRGRIDVTDLVAAERWDYIRAVDYCSVQCMEKNDAYEREPVRLRR